MRIETERLIITEFDLSMAESVHKNSLDEDNRRFVPIEEVYEVGYHIGKEYTGNGYATEALKAFLLDIMPAKNLNKVYGICVSENMASVKVLEKCGFQKEYEGMGQYQGENRQITKYVLKVRWFE